MGLPDEVKRQVLSIQVLCLANPQSMKAAFTSMIDTVIESAVDIVIDWGTVEIASKRVLDSSDGQELVLYELAVQVMKLEGVQE